MIVIIVALTRPICLDRRNTRSSIAPPRRQRRSTSSRLACEISQSSAPSCTCNTPSDASGRSTSYFHTFSIASHPPISPRSTPPPIDTLLSPPSLDVSASPPPSSDDASAPSTTHPSPPTRPPPLHHTKPRSTLRTPPTRARTVAHLRVVVSSSPRLPRVFVVVSPPPPPPSPPPPSSPHVDHRHRSKTPRHRTHRTLRPRRPPATHRARRDVSIHRHPQPTRLKYPTTTPRTSTRRRLHPHTSPSRATTTTERRYDGHSTRSRLARSLARSIDRSLARRRLSMRAHTHTTTSHERSRTPSVDRSIEAVRVASRPSSID